MSTRPVESAVLLRPLSSLNTREHTGRERDETRSFPAARSWDDPLREIRARNVNTSAFNEYSVLRRQLGASSQASRSR